MPRVLGDNVSPAYDESALTLPPVFEWLRSEGKVSQTDMRRTFNCGIGGVLIVDREIADDTLHSLKTSGEEARIIGHLKNS